MALGDINKLNRLDAGMSQPQVERILGQPKQKELKAGRTILKYSLHQWLVGWKPVYLVFDQNRLLAEWFVNVSEFMERQSLWMEAWKEVGRNQRNARET